jgi:HEPN domain-containing protein
MNKYVTEWIKKADNDLEVAVFLFKNGMNMEIVAFHCQQATEKYLKSFLVSKEIKVPKTHDLDALLMMCVSENDKFNEFDRVAVSSMTDFAVDYRYPVFNPIPPNEEVENFLNIAKYLEETIKTLI